MSLYTCICVCVVMCVSVCSYSESALANFGHKLKPPQWTKLKRNLYSIKVKPEWPDSDGAFNTAASKQPYVGNVGS
jgi:hypothetical protein